MHARKRCNGCTKGCVPLCCCHLLYYIEPCPHVCGSLHVSDMGKEHPFCPDLPARQRINPLVAGTDEAECAKQIILHARWNLECQRKERQTLLVAGAARENSCIVGQS